MTNTSCSAWFVVIKWMQEHCCLHDCRPVIERMGILGPSFLSRALIYNVIAFMLSKYSWSKRRKSFLCISWMAIMISYYEMKRLFQNWSSSACNQINCWTIFLHWITFSVKWGAICANARQLRWVKGTQVAPQTGASTPRSTTRFLLCQPLLWLCLIHKWNDLNYDGKMSWLMGNCDHDNEPRRVGCLCWLPDLSWWACSSVPGGLALVFDSIPIKPHSVKSWALENQPWCSCDVWQ